MDNEEWEDDEEEDEDCKEESRCMFLPDPLGRYNPMINKGI